MRKGICPKCNELIEVDENVNPYFCPKCHAQINSIDCIKTFNRTVNALKRKGEIAFAGSTEYQKAYEAYSNLLKLADDVLVVLTSTAISRLYCTDLHHIYIREATNILVNGSSKVEINNNNAKTLSEFLKKFREDCLLIITSFSTYKTQSKYALNLYHQALEEYIYFLNYYLDIYNAMDKLNKLFVEGSDVIKEEIKKAQEKLKEKVGVSNSSEAKHDFLDINNKVVTNIFPNKKNIFITRMILYGTMGIGFILSIIGLILLSTNENKTVAGIVLGIGLVMFVGSYFIGHNLKSKNYNLNY